MPTWLRVCALLLVVAWSMYRGIRIEKRVHARLIRASRVSAARAVCVAVGYHAAILAATGLFAVAAAALDAAGPGWLAIIALLAGLAATAPFLWALAPGQPYGGSATAFGDLRGLGATPPVARGLAYTGIVMFFACMAGPVATVAAVLVIDR